MTSTPRFLKCRPYAALSLTGTSLSSTVSPPPSSATPLNPMHPTNPREDSNCFPFVIFFSSFSMAVTNLHQPANSVVVVVSPPQARNHRLFLSCCCILIISFAKIPIGLTVTDLSVSIKDDASKILGMNGLYVRLMQPHFGKGLCHYRHLAQTVITAISLATDEENRMLPG